MGVCQRAAAVFWGPVEPHRGISLALVVAAPVISFLISRVSGSWVLVTVLLVVQLGVAAATWWLGEARASRLQTERIDSRQETLVVLGDALDPVMVELAATTTLPKPDQRAKRSGLVTLVLSAATGIADERTRPRACYFRRDALDRAGRARMTHEAYVGRSIPAKAEFIEGTEAGDVALRMVNEGRHLFCDDVRENPPPGWEPSERGEYRTFISVTVAAGERAYGMLTLDAVEAGALIAEDVEMMRVLGHVLGMVETVTA